MQLNILYNKGIKMEEQKEKPLIPELIQKFKNRKKIKLQEQVDILKLELEKIKIEKEIREVKNSMPRTRISRSNSAPPEQIKKEIQEPEKTASEEQPIKKPFLKFPIRSYGRGK